MYVAGLMGFAILNKEFSNLTFLENQNFGNRSEWTEFLENDIISELEDDSLVDTD